MSGRTFGASDIFGAPLVVMINEALAKQYFPGVNPIGQRITFDRVPDSTSHWREIVGVVGNEHQASFGVLAQLVQSRSREMGIRMALGAQQSQVKWLVVCHGATLLSGGIVAGLSVALGATRVLTTLLYEVQPTDALTYAAVALLIGAAGMLAAWVRARRASSADPALTLRAE
jgi:hypothetical protein